MSVPSQTGDRFGVQNGKGTVKGPGGANAGLSTKNPGWYGMVHGQEPDRPTPLEVTTANRTEQLGEPVACLRLTA